MAGKFELYTDKAGEHRFRLKSADGSNVGSSEGYKEKSSALNGIESVKKNAGLPERYQVFEGKSGGKWYYNLKAGNHQVILSSSGFATQQDAQQGTQAVALAAVSAITEEL